MGVTGQTILGRYRLVERLGAGLGGETWEAEGPDGPVALKLIPTDPARVRDLQREASVLRALRHPNVVAYRDFASLADGAVLVTELVEGGDLSTWVGLQGARSPEETAALGLQLVAALEALEEACLVHRDLKPGNVLVDLDGEGRAVLKLADFGIAREVVEGGTRTEDRSLTPAYAAPEQHTGGTLTGAADRYALGGVLGFLATGRHPMGTVETGDPGLDTVTERLRHPDPEQRPGLPALRQALTERAAGHATPSLALPLPPPPVRRRTLLPWLVALAGMVVLGALLAWPERSPPRVAPVRTVPIEEVATGTQRTPTRTELQPAAGPRSPVERQVPDGPVTLFVNSRPWSWVSVDGQSLGRTSDLGSRFQVSAGSHQVQLRSDSGLTWETTLELAADHRLCVNLRTGTAFAC